MVLFQGEGVRHGSSTLLNFDATLGKEACLFGQLGTPGRVQGSGSTAYRRRPNVDAKSTTMLNSYESQNLGRFSAMQAVLISTVLGASRISTVLFQDMKTALKVMEAPKS